MKRELQRVQKLIEIRERERNLEVSELVRVRSAELALEAAEQQCMSELLSAEEDRRKFSSDTRIAADYLAQEDWLETLGMRHALARRKLVQARNNTRRQQVKVNAAQMRMKQLELLKERILRAEQARLRRIERRSEDEMAQRAFASGSKDDL